MGSSLTQRVYTPKKWQARVPNRMIWLWGDQRCSARRACQLREHMFSSPSTKGYPKVPWDAEAEPTPAPPHHAACEGQHPDSTPSREHRRAGTYGEPVCSYTQHPFLELFNQVPGCRNKQDTGPRARPDLLRSRDEYFTLPRWNSLTSPSLLPRGANICT